MKGTPTGVVAAQILLAFALSSLVGAQTTTTLSGTVKDPKGTPVPSAKVSLKNSSTGQTTEATSDSQGAYHFADLASGEYELTTSASGFETKTDIVHLQSTPQSEDVALTQTGGPSLSDLGFNTADTKGNAEEQARLDKRTHMLKIHQKMGLITAVPLAATIITGFGAGGHQTSSSTRDLHAALGGTTAALYFTTAYFAIGAPKISGTETRGPIRVHRALVDPWNRDGADADSRHHGFPAEESRRTYPRHRSGPWAGGNHHRRGLRRGAVVSLSEVLTRQVHEKRMARALAMSCEVLHQNVAAIAPKTGFSIRCSEDFCRKLSGWCQAHLLTL